MLSRGSLPLFRNHYNLSKTVNRVIPAAYTTLHGTNHNGTNRHNGQLKFSSVTGSRLKSQPQQFWFTPVTGITPRDTHALNQRLFHGSPRHEDRFDWRKYARKVEAPDWLKQMSPQAITAEASSDVQPYLRLMRFDRPIGTYIPPYEV